MGTRILRLVSFSIAKAAAAGASAEFTEVSCAPHHPLPGHESFVVAVLLRSQMVHLFIPVYLFIANTKPSTKSILKQPQKRFFFFCLTLGPASCCCYITCFSSPFLPHPGVWRRIKFIVMKNNEQPGKFAKNAQVRRK